jgi:GAF domain-containing protein
MTTGGESAVAERVAEQILEVAGAARSAVVLGEDANTAIHFVAAAGDGAERLVGARGPAAGSGLCGNVLEGSCSILSIDTIGDPRIHQGHAREGGITTAIGVPVSHEGRPFAVLMALNRADGGRFSAQQEAALERYAEEIAAELWHASHPAGAHDRPSTP